MPDALAHVRLVLITDARMPEATLLRAFTRAVERLPRGTFALQLRDKLRSSDALEPIARALRAATHAGGVPFVIGDHVDLAVAVGADGVHVPGGLAPLRAAAERLAPGFPISAPCHVEDDPCELVAVGAKALFVSPIFATPDIDRPKGNARGVAALAAVRRSIVESTRVVALGGIASANAAACFDAGASALAFVRPWLDEARAAGELEALAKVVSGLVVR